MLINNPVITGSFTVNGTNFITNTPTTGSNTFNGNQIISGSAIVTGSLQVTGSMTATGTITAQTLVVQTVTSSVVYSSGSNVFGNSQSNVQQMTGSVTITGSLGINTTTTGSVLEVAGTSAITDFRISRTVSPSTYFFIMAPGGTPSTSNVGINGTNVMSLTSSGSIGIGSTSPSYKLDIQNSGDFDIRLRDNTLGGTVGILFETANDFSGTSQAYIKGIGASNSGISDLIFGTAGTSGATSATERFRIKSTGQSEFKIYSETVFDMLVLNNTAATSAGVRQKFQNGYGDLGAIRVLQRDNGSLADDGQMEFQVASNASLSTVFTLRNDGLITTAGATSPYNFDPGGRVMYVNSLGQVGSTSSTRESKIHINPLTGVDYIMQLNPVSFYHRIQDTETRTYTDEYFDEIKYGFIADEVEKVNLDLVFYNENEDGTKKLAGVEYMSMIAVLTKAIQEQQAQIEALKTEIEILKNK